MSSSMAQYMKILGAIKEFCSTWWRYSTADLNFVKLSKIDVSLDLAGSFQGGLSGAAYATLQGAMQRAIEEVFSSDQTNFLSKSTIEGLKVRKGENLLHTSFQYSVREGRGA